MANAYGASLVGAWSSCTAISDRTRPNASRSAAVAATKAVGTPSGDSDAPMDVTLGRPDRRRATERGRPGEQTGQQTGHAYACPRLTPDQATWRDRCGIGWPVDRGATPTDARPGLAGTCCGSTNSAVPHSTHARSGHSAPCPSEHGGCSKSRMSPHSGHTRWVNPSAPTWTCSIRTPLPGHVHVGRVRVDITDPLIPFGPSLTVARTCPIATHSAPACRACPWVSGWSPLVSIDH